MSAKRNVIDRLAVRHHEPVVHFQTVVFQTVVDDGIERVPMEHWIWEELCPPRTGHQLMADE